MSHRWILPIGTELSFEGLSGPIKILRGLGAGTQGQVFAVDVAGEELALKWYLPACIAGDPHLNRRLNDSIRLSAPNADFLWPIALWDRRERVARRFLQTCRWPPCSPLGRSKAGPP